MKKYLSFLIAIFFLAPCLAFPNAVSFRIGYFIPRADSDLWKIEFENMDFKLSNYQNSTFGFAYEIFLTKNLSFLVGTDSYSKEKAGSYKDYVGYSYIEGDFAFPNDYEGEFNISHAFNVSITPIQFSLKFLPLGRRGNFMPYLGGGAGIYLWSLRLIGDMIDFNDIWYYDDPKYGEVEIYGIYSADAREESKFKIGYHAFAGFMIPLGERLTLETEFKYNFIKTDISDSFEDFDLFDLSGYQISLGINYWF